MKKPLYLGFVVLCLAICSVLSVGFLINGPSAAGANELLADEPALFDENGELNTAWLSDWSSYFGDRFYLRQELISAHNMLVSKLFGSSPEDSVIVGKDGWLFYGSTIDDYTGADPMSGREIFSAAKNLALMQEHCLSSGAGFLFTMAPNKNALYPEYMPDLGAVNPEPDVERLYALLDDMGVGYLNMHELFESVDEPLYFAHDSHWNSRGAALAADAINACFGRESDYFGGDFSASESHSGDLYEMLYPALSDPETNPVYGGELVCDYGGGPSRADSITLNTTGAGEGSLLCYRDSFGELLHPFLADGFGSAKFSRSTSYDLTAEYDCVVIELVERNLDYLINYVPVMPSPERAVSPEGEGAACSVERQGAPTATGLVLWRGALGDTPDEDSPVYLLCGDTAYECFLLADGGFAAYIPDGAAVTGAACYVNGVLTVGITG